MASIYIFGLNTYNGITCSNFCGCILEIVYYAKLPLPWCWEPAVVYITGVQPSDKVSISCDASVNVLCKDRRSKRTQPVNLSVYSFLVILIDYLIYLHYIVQYILCALDPGSGFRSLELKRTSGVKIFWYCPNFKITTNEVWTV